MQSERTGRQRHARAATVGCHGLWFQWLSRTGWEPDKRQDGNCSQHAQQHSLAHTQGGGRRHDCSAAHSTKKQSTNKTSLVYMTAVIRLVYSVHTIRSCCGGNSPSLLGGRLVPRDGASTRGRPAHPLFHAHRRKAAEHGLRVLGRQRRPAAAGTALQQHGRHLLQDAAS